MSWDVTGEMISSITEDDIRVWSVCMGGKCIEYPSGKRFRYVILTSFFLKEIP